MPLSDSERRLLDFERSWWMEAGAKADQIRRRLGVSPTAYYSALRRLVERLDALEYDPLLVRRLRRRDDQRRRTRYEVTAPPLRRRPR
jgi:DNA-binding MarR family transcriptional regulator